MLYLMIVFCFLFFVFVYIPLAFLARIECLSCRISLKT